MYAKGIGALDATEQDIARQDKREAFKRDALRAWEDYQATGLHATADEVEKWLNSWGTDHEEPAPTGRLPGLPPGGEHDPYAQSPASR